jgi:hypothetical protein
MRLSNFRVHRVRRIRRMHHRKQSVLCLRGGLLSFVVRLYKMGRRRWVGGENASVLVVITV